MDAVQKQVYLRQSWFRRCRSCFAGDVDWSQRTCAGLSSCQRWVMAVETCISVQESVCSARSRRIPLTCKAGHLYHTLLINDCHTALVSSFINSPAPCASWGTDLHGVQSTADSAALIFNNSASVIARCVMSSLLRHCADGMAVIIIIIIIIEVEFLLGGSSPYTSTDETNKNKYT